MRPSSSVLRNYFLKLNRRQMLLIVHNPRCHEIVVLRFAPADVDCLSDPLAHPVAEKSCVAEFSPFFEFVRSEIPDFLGYVLGGKFNFNLPKVH